MHIMAVSVLTSHVFAPAKLISDAGGTESGKLNIRTDPFAIWTDPFAKCLYIIYTYSHGLMLMARPRIGNLSIQYHIQPFYTFPAANSMPVRPPID